MLPLEPIRNTSLKAPILNEDITRARGVEGKDSGFRPHRARCSIDDERATQPMPAKLLVNGKATNKAGRKRRVTRQSPSLILRQFIQR
jgi:hypothetical protein